MKKVTSYVLAAIGGLIFCLDTATVASATRHMKGQFSLNSFQEGWAVSVVLICCMFGGCHRFQDEYLFPDSVLRSASGVFMTDP